MSNFPILDLVVGMIFVYFLISIVCSSVVEVVLNFFKVRSKFLTQWLLTIFKNEMGRNIMNHPSVSALSKNNKSPDYIDATNFSMALLDTITCCHKDQAIEITTDVETYIKLIKENDILSPELKRLFIIYANEANMTVGENINKLQIFRKKIEDWYDTSMQRVGGTLKKKYARPATFVVALIAVVALNADSISLCKFLYSNKDISAKLANQGMETTKDSLMLAKMNEIKASKTENDTVKISDEQAKANIEKNIKDTKKAIAQLDTSLPIGWKDGEVHALFCEQKSGLFSKFAGLMMTILATMMGAPFWFDILNKISNVRSSGNKPVEGNKKEESA